MTCREFTDFIADYLSGEIAAPARATFESHLDRCPNCRRYLDSYEASVTLGRAAFSEPEADVPVDVPERLVEAILAAQRRG